MTNGVVMVSNAVMPDQLGGLQRYVRDLAGAVVAQGMPVTILTKRTSRDLPSGETFSDGVRIRRYDILPRSHRLYALGYPLASLQATRSAGRASELLHVHYPLQGFAPAILGTRYVHTFHAPIYRELIPEHHDRYLLPRLFRVPLVGTARVGESLVARRAAATIVLTEYMRNELAVLAPGTAQRASAIPGGLDERLFCPGAPIDHPVARGGWPLLLTARRLVPRTGVGELGQAMPAVLRELPAARLAIAGDGPLRDAIAALIRDLSLSESVFMLGRVSDEELVGWYRAATLFVLPTQELEGFGMSTIEALACGTPAIGTPSGGTVEVLGGLDPALLAHGSSPDALADAVLAVANSPQLLQMLAEKARRHVVPRMTWRAIADRHLELYERMQRIPDV